MSDLRQRIMQARIAARQRHQQFMQAFAGATYRHELGLCQIEDKLPIQSRHTIAALPVIRPSSRPVERHTDKYNFKNLRMAALVDESIRRHKDKYHYLPETIYLSMHNIWLLALQGYERFYHNFYGEFRLCAQEGLNDDEIMCE